MKKTSLLLLLALFLFQCTNKPKEVEQDELSPERKFNNRMSTFYSEMEKNEAFSKLEQRLNEALALATDKDDSCHVYLGYCMIYLDHAAIELAHEYNRKFSLDCRNDSLKWYYQKTSIHEKANELDSMLFCVKKTIPLVKTKQDRLELYLRAALLHTEFQEFDSSCFYTNMLKAEGEFELIDEDFKKRLDYCE